MRTGFKWLHRSFEKLHLEMQTWFNSCVSHKNASYSGWEEIILAKKDAPSHLLSPKFRSGMRPEGKRGWKVRRELASNFTRANLHTHSPLCVLVCFMNNELVNWLRWLLKWNLAFRMHVKIGERNFRFGPMRPGAVHLHKLGEFGLVIHTKKQVTQHFISSKSMLVSIVLQQTGEKAKFIQNKKSRTCKVSRQNFPLDGASDSGHPVSCFHVRVSWSSAFALQTTTSIFRGITVHRQRLLQTGNQKPVWKI